MTSCALRPSGSVTGTTVPLTDPSGVDTEPLKAPATPYCCSTASGVIACVSRLHAGKVAPAATMRAALAVTIDVARILSAPFLLRPHASHSGATVGTQRMPQEEACQDKRPTF